MSEKVNQRNRTVLYAAFTLATRDGLRNITRESVAAEAGVSVGSVSNSFLTMDGLRAAVLRYAIDLVSTSKVAAESISGALGIIAAALAERDPVALSAPAIVKARALESLALAA